MKEHKIVKWFMVFFILQWNAHSLIANGQEFKRYVSELPSKPDVICIQETWLKPQLDFNLNGYNSIRCDREIDGGGCMTFIKEGISYSPIKITEEYECVVTEIFNNEDKGNMIIINYYNSCKALSNEVMKNIYKGHKGGILMPIILYGEVELQI